MFFQVGCFYEFYGKQALRAINILNLKRIEGKHGFKIRCGIGIDALGRFLKIALEKRRAAVVVKQTGYYLPRLVERRVHEIYFPISPVIGRIDFRPGEAP